MSVKNFEAYHDGHFEDSFVTANLFGKHQCYRYSNYYAITLGQVIKQRIKSSKYWRQCKVQGQEQTTKTSKWV